MVVATGLGALGVAGLAGATEPGASALGKVKQTLKDMILKLSERMGKQDAKKPAAKDEAALTDEEVVLIEENWKKVAALGEEAVGVLLFKHIFTDAPQAVDLFSFASEFKTQGYESPKLKKHAAGVVRTVGKAVDGLRKLDELVPVLKELGRKHGAYGVVPAHFDIVGAALLKTLGDGLAADFTPASKQAWTKVYGVVRDTMLAGMAKKDEAKNDEAALTDAQIAMVEQTWKQVEGLGAEAVGVLLFKKIFEIAPEAINLFSFKDEANLYESPKLKKHGVNVVTHVGLAVASLRKLDDIVPALKALGKRHVGYAVQPAHFEVVGKALIETLSDGLGEAFNPEVEAAWVKVFGIVQATMLTAWPQ